MSIDERDQRLFGAVELLAKQAKNDKKMWRREQYRRHILELLEPRESCEKTVRMVLRNQKLHYERMIRKETADDSDKEGYESALEILEALPE